MKVTIDTKEDSKQEIKKALDFLNTLVGLEHMDTSTTTDIFASAIKDTSAISTENSQPSSSLRTSASSSSPSKSSTTALFSPKSEKQPASPADIFDVEELFEDEK